MSAEEYEKRTTFKAINTDAADVVVGRVGGVNIPVPPEQPQEIKPKK